MSAAQTEAEKALSLLLPDGADPATTIELACHTAFLVRDRLVADDVVTAVRAHPEQAAALIVGLAAMVDVGQRPGDLVAWLGSARTLRRQTALAVGALAEARTEYDAIAADTLPPVTLESMREMAHAARLAGVRQPCGTVAAHGRHVRAGQEPCFRCARARHLYDSATPQQRKLIRTPIGASPSNVRPSCGSPAGYTAHLAAMPKEEPCPACREARRVYDAGRYRERGPRRKQQNQLAKPQKLRALVHATGPDEPGPAQRTAA